MTHATALTLLTRDLEARSSGSPGCRLMARIEEACPELPAFSRPLEVALWLREESPRSDRALDRLAVAATSDAGIAVVVLVALVPELEGALRRATLGSPGEDLWAELMLAAFEGLAFFAQAPPEERREEFVAAAVRLARARTRRDGDPRVVRVDYDVPSPEVERDTVEPRMAALGLALAGGVVSLGDFAIVEATRLRGVRLAPIAQGLSLSYDQLRMRRNRTERRLRAFIEHRLAHS